jgi:hypothetical protein
MRVNVFKQFLVSFFVVGTAAILWSCSSSSTTASSFACTASATLVSGSEYNDLTVTMTDGTGPFTITLPLTNSTPVSSTTATYTYDTTFTITSTTVSVVDTSDNASATCYINGNSTGSTTGTGTIATTGNVTVTASGTVTTPTLNEPLTLTATDQIGLTSPTFSYTLDSSSAGVTVTGAGGVIIVENTEQSEVVLTVNEYVGGSSVASATATVTLTYAGGITTASNNPTMLGSIDCTLENYGSSTGTYAVNTPIYFELTSPSGPVLIYNLVPGNEAWGAGANIPSLTNEWGPTEFWLEFSTAGVQQTIQVWGQLEYQPGYLCNGGNPVTGVITIE